MVQNPKGGGLSSSFGGGGQQLGGVQKTSDFWTEAHGCLLDFVGTYLTIQYFTGTAVRILIPLIEDNTLEQPIPEVIPETLPEYHKKILRIVFCVMMSALLL